MRGYGERSAEARERLAGVLRRPATAPTLDEKLDIFPAAQPNAPVFVFIHGGYWRAFSAKDHSFVALGPVALGITTVVVDYSLCPKVTIDEITRQCRAAVAWTLAPHRRARRRPDARRDRRPLGRRPPRARCAWRRAGTRTTAWRAIRSPRRCW